MKAIKYLLLIMLCFYGEQIYSQKKAVWVPDSIYNRQIKKFPTEKQNVSLKHILT